MTHACTPVRGYTEGAAGMRHQVDGLARELGGNYLHQAVQLKRPWRWSPASITPFASWMFTDPQLVTPGNEVPSPQIVLSCGRQGLAANLIWKRQLQDRVYSIHIQDPRIDPARLDLIAVPEHDDLHGSNVLVTRGAVHHVNRTILDQAARDLPGDHPLLGVPRPFAVVLLGGESRHHSFTSQDADELLHRLHRAARLRDCGLVLLPSRRTPPKIVAQLSSIFGQTSRGGRHYVWTEPAQNPYLAALALCSHVVVTSDSVSMASEATAAGKPIHVFRLTAKRTAHRIDRFHEQFERAGITRPFEGELNDWTYAPLDEAARIARIIHNLRGTDVPVQRSENFQRAA